MVFIVFCKTMKSIKSRYKAEMGDRLGEGRDEDYNRSVEPF
jgi:hypothetical protein